MILPHYDGEDATALREDKIQGVLFTDYKIRFERWSDVLLPNYFGPTEVVNFSKFH